MATLPDLTWNTLELLYGIPQFERPIEDTLVQGPTTGTDLEIEMANPDLWKRGDYIQLIVADRLDPTTQVELSVFTEDHPAAGNTATLRRRVVFDNQSQIDWDPEPTTAYAQKNPLFPIHAAHEAVQEVLDSELWPHVWTTQTRKLTSVQPSIDQLKDLSAGDEDIVRVYQYNLTATGGIKELPFGWWDYEASLHSDLSSLPSIVVRRVHDENEPVYVVVKNRPSTSLVANVSTQIETMIPHMAAAKLLLGRISGVDYDPSRQERGQYNRRSYAREHYQTFASEFLRLRGAEHDRLMKEQPKAPKRYRGHPLRVRRLTG